MTYDDRAISRPGDPPEDRLGGASSVSGPEAIPPAACPVCNDPALIELPIDWRERVDEGGHFELVGCGNPWHYRGLDPDPLGTALAEAIESDRHDGGLLLPLLAFGLAGAIIGAIAVIALIGWGRS